jgi:hypothetical protein
MSSARFWETLDELLTTSVRILSAGRRYFAGHTDGLRFPTSAPVSAAQIL